MNYIQIDSTERVIADVTKILKSQLENSRTVLWLLAGGSALPLEAEIAKNLAGIDTKNLRITFTDERYGEPGHPDENYTQLLGLGFSLPQASVYRVLTGKDRITTTEEYGRQLEEWFDTSDYRFAMLGIGPDGHTAGIKPRSPAVASEKPSVIYDWGDFTRLTMTPPMIRRLDEAIIYAVGSEKAATLQSLVRENLPLADQPAQVLKDIKASTLYTDTIL
jgi:6-phosphogluconolactonase/glucosamine-6-phosphate isomerase/deaminase